MPCRSHLSQECASLAMRHDYHFGHCRFACTPEFVVFSLHAKITFCLR